MKTFWLLLTLGGLPLLLAQNAAKPDPAKTAPVVKPEATKPVLPPISAEWQTKTFQLQFVDPEQLRALFTGRSFVIETNRELKVMTVHGSAAFLKEVEDAVKRFDVPVSPPANLQITVYLVTSPAQAPAGVALPAEISAMGKEFGSKPGKLADLQVLRVREGQSGQLMGLTSKPEAASISRVWLQASAVNPGGKGDKVSLYGLRVWLGIPGTPQANLKADPDVAADVDIDANEAVMVSKVGVEEPVMVVVRASVIH